LMGAKAVTMLAVASCCCWCLFVMTVDAASNLRWRTGVFLANQNRFLNLFSYTECEVNAADHYFRSTMTREKIEVAVRTLLSNLPDNLKGYWLNRDVLRTILREGGFPGLPSEVLDNSLLGFRRSLLPAKERFGKDSRTYYKFGLDEETKCQTVLDQHNEKNLRLPRVHPGYFREKTRCNMARYAAEALDEKGYHVASNKESHQSMDSRNEDKENNSNGAPSSANRADLETSEGSNNVQSCRKGYKIVDIDEENAFVAALQDHATTCHHAMSCTIERKMGFDIHSTYV